MKKPQPIPDDIYELRGIHTDEDWRPSVSVGGKVIEAKVEWLSKMEPTMTVREALELYPANPHVSHAEGGGAWASEDLEMSTKNHLNIESTLDMTIRNYLENHGDRVMRVSLNLGGFGIRSIDEVIGLDTIPRIDELNLSGNLLGDDSVAALARMSFADTLQNLILYNNQIKRFPSSAFPILEHLILYHNGILGLDTIEPSDSLEWLNLAQNGIKAVFSADLAKFPNLIKLDLSNNEITEIPVLTNLENTWDVKLRNWQVKPLSNLVERRFSHLKVLFILIITANPIISVDPLNAAFIKANVRDGKLLVTCDESISEIIDRA